MSSSISSSNAAWRAPLAALLISLLAVSVLVACIVVLSDPYDRGQFTPLPSFGVPAFNQRLSNVSIARNPSFNAAIFGNSTMQLVDPDRITEGAALRFASIVVQGTEAREQIAMARWFVMNHTGATQAIVWGLDQPWCRSEGVAENTRRPFPYWLYDDNPLKYLIGIWRFDSIKHAGVKLLTIFGYVPRAAANGYENYESLVPWRREQVEKKLSKPLPDEPYDINRADFPALRLLKEFVDSLPAETRVVFVFLPRHINNFPAPGSPMYERDERCLNILKKIASERPRRALLNLLKDNAAAHDVSNWWDLVHFRNPVARSVEAEISSSLNAMADTAR